MQIADVKPIMKGITLASVTIIMPKWGGFFIKNVVVFEKQGSRWIAFPSDTFEKDGKKMYARKCGYDDRDMQKSFEKEFFKVFDEYVKENPLTSPQQQTGSYTPSSYQSKPPSQQEDLWF